jgi:RsiW-degrading membrane proteinase PrsW (M82 family)
MMVIDPLVLAGSLVVTAAFLCGVVVVVWWVDRYDREPWPLVFGVFLWGLVVAPALVTATGGLIAASGALGGGFPIATTVAPVIEELAKGIGILLVVVFSEHFDNPTDGLVYGTAVGLGFAVTENLLVGLWSVQVLDHGGIVSLIIQRTLFSAGVHALASSAFGAGLGFGRTAGKRILAIGWALLGLTVAIGLHAGWNLATATLPSSPDWLFPAVILGPLYLLYVCFFAVMLWGEHRMLVTQLSEEVELGVFPEWVARVIPYYRRRVRAEWWPSRQERIVISRLLTRLAFRKHALAASGDSASIEGLEIVSLRARLQTILGEPETKDLPDDPPPAADS